MVAAIQPLVDRCRCRSVDNGTKLHRQNTGLRRTSSMVKWGIWLPPWQRKTNCYQDSWNMSNARTLDFGPPTIASEAKPSPQRSWSTSWRLITQSKNRVSTLNRTMMTKATSNTNDTHECNFLFLSLSLSQNHRNRNIYIYMHSIHAVLAKVDRVGWADSAYPLHQRQE